MIAYTVSLYGKVVYVGICNKTTLRGRWTRHLNDATKKNSNLLLHQAIRKHGVDVFKTEHVASAKTWADLCVVEQLLIEQHRTFCWLDDGGLNMTIGGEGAVGAKQDAESIERSAAKRRGRIVSSDTRMKSSLSHTGLKRSPEAIEKGAAFHRGRKRAPETRIKMSVAQKTQKERKQSPETRERCSAARKRVWLETLRIAENEHKTMLNLNSWELNR